MSGVLQVNLVFYDCSVVVLTVQSVQFFGYTLLVCYVFTLMLGAVGFYSSLVFVRYIYKHLKLD
jgi:transmembrane 9 superfamily protein 1